MIKEHKYDFLYLWTPNDQQINAVFPVELFVKYHNSGTPMSRTLIFAATLTQLASASPVICTGTDDSLYARNTHPCPNGSQEWRGAGANLFDVFWVASSGQARNKFGFNYSLSELETAHAAGIRVFRAFASDWGPNKLFWKQHTETVSTRPEFSSSSESCDT